MSKKKITNLFEEASKEFDTRKQVNRAPRYTFNEQFMEQLKEEGLTLEMLEEIQQKVPIFKYQTQITIHGQFPKTQLERIHGYKNCIRNDNGTLGLRYNAIDVQKKKELDQMLALVRHHKDLRLPKLRHNSTEMVFVMESVTPEPIKEMYHRINTSLFYGRKKAYKVEIPLIATLYVLEVEIGVFKKDKLWSIFTNWTGMSKKAYKELQEKAETEALNAKAAIVAHEHERIENCQKNYKAAVQQLQDLSRWDGNFYPNTVVIRGLKKSSGMGFQFALMQKGAFGRIKVAIQNTTSLTDFNPDSYSLEKTMSLEDFKQKLHKKEWFVYQAIEKPQVQPKEAPKKADPQPAPAASSLKGKFEYFYYGRGTALFGDTELYKEDLGKNGMGGGYNPNLTHPVTGKKTKGWVFTAKPEKIEEVETFFSITCQKVDTKKAA